MMHFSLYITIGRRKYFGLTLFVSTKMMVLRMCNIYSTATKVEVWLGKADSSGIDASAVELLKKWHIFQGSRNTIGMGH